MLNMKKIFVTCTILTAFCTSAFAASADSQPQPSMSERVNAILHENDADRPCPPPAHRMHRQGPKLTPEQRAERQKMREEWKRMTPEQRADPRFSRGTNGRCRRCYERWRKAEIKTIRGDLKFRIGRRWTTFCGCGCAGARVAR